jgi:ChrR Cupin-like domain
MRPSVYTRQSRERVHVFDATPMPWEETARPGLTMKTIRIDDERGEFLGLIRFDRFVRSGVHQHQGVASSFILEGGLTDYHGPVLQHQMGINFRGSTHDAMAYVPSVLVSKLEGPVTYPKSEQLISGIHAGSTYRDFKNPAPEVAPEINVDVDRVVPIETGIAGLRRQPVYDYAGSGLTRRMLQWQLRPETTVPAWQASDWVELWVRGGELIVNDSKAYANCFVVIEPGATVRMAAPFGAIALVWAEGREQVDSGANLLGF